ncbi:MAG TPA: hypothetical protein VFE92_09005 [Dermatophilaceae bacterium]|nr:hypothetical protein [Dermatophilaceae bacterium]
MLKQQSWSEHDYQLFHYRDRFVAGVVLGMSDTGYQFADRLYGLPAADLW